MLTAFYQTAAQLCFTLLGLWWLVLQTKYSEWVYDRLRRRVASSISLYFLLPGSMSLIALLATNLSLLWRVAFAVAWVFGAGAKLPIWSMPGTGALDASKRPGFGLASLTPARWVGVVLYLGIFAISVAPQIAQSMGIAPLVVAGIGLSLIVVLGVSLAWAFFLETAPAPAGGDTKSPLDT